MINEKRLIQRFIDLCKIHGESKDEIRVANYLTEYFKENGYSVERDTAHEKFGGNSGNLYVRIPGTKEGPTLMLSAHMDTVVTGGEVEPIIEDGIIKSKGNTILGSDDKAGLAQILEVVDILKENNLEHPPLFLALMAAEEIGLLGAAHCELTEKDADMGVVLDTSGPIGKIVNQAPFHEQYKIKVYGKAAHAGIEPEKGINAIQIAGALVAQLPSGRISKSATANVAQIRGGVANNIVPEQVTVNGEVRSTNQDEMVRILEEISNWCEEFSEDHGVKITFTSKREYDGYELPLDSPIIKRLESSAREIGKEPFVVPTGGGSDANFFNRKGIPTAVISCGMDKVHTHNEQIAVQDLIDTTAMVLSFVQQD